MAGVRLLAGAKNGVSITSGARRKEMTISRHRHYCLEWRSQARQQVEDLKWWSSYNACGLRAESYVYNNLKSGSTGVVESGSKPSNRSAT